MKDFNLSLLRLYWLLVCIFITNISQMPQILEISYFRLVNICCWLLLFLMNTPVLLKSTTIVHNKIIKNIFILYYLYMFMLFCCELVRGKGYLISFNLYSISLAIFIFINGYLTFANLGEDELRLILKTYIISALLTLVDVYYLYYMNITSSMLSWNYAYQEKNTIAVINLFTLIILLVIQVKKVWKRIFKYSLILFLVYFLVILKCRTAIVGGFFALFCWFVCVKGSKKKKLFIFFLGTVSLFLILSIDRLYDLFIINLFLNGKIDGGSIDLSSATSSRSDTIPFLLSSLQEHFFFGNGYSGHGRIESGLIYSLIVFGVIGSIPYITLALLPFFSAIKKQVNKNSLVNSLFLYYAAISTVNFLLEQDAPFGPGAKFSFFWLIFGIYVRFNSDILGDSTRKIESR